VEKEYLQLHLRTVHAKVETVFGYCIAAGPLWRGAVNECSSGEDVAGCFSSELYLPARSAASHGSCCFRRQSLREAFGDNIALHHQVAAAASA